MRSGPFLRSPSGGIRRFIALAAGALCLAACSSGAGSSNSQASSGAGASSSGIAEAVAAVKDSTAPLTGKPPGSPIDVSSLRGKSIALIVVSGSQFGRTVASGMQAAGQALGIKVTPYFGDGTLDTGRTQIANAITSGVQGIVLESYDPTSLRDSLNSAAAKGIKIVAFGQYDYGEVPEAGKAASVLANVGTCYKCMGKLMADALAADSGGKADALFLNVPEIGVANLIKEDFTKELARVCPGCKVTNIDSSTGNIKTQLPQAVSSALVKNPDIKYVVPVFDIYAAFFESSITSSQSGDQIKLLGADASGAQLQEMQKGSSPKWLYDVGYNPAEMGWAAVDQLMRVMLDKPAITNSYLPNRGFTPDVVKGLDISTYPDGWFGQQSNYYQQGYLDLWTGRQ